ncbi:MAG TPA: BamA/TamA family outer membrane protein [Vicinamibacterales bacterium]|nr:BamA/TamA family outer membrane protein [Vicinamibacterales bacterium]
MIARVLLAALVAASGAPASAASVDSAAAIRAGQQPEAPRETIAAITVHGNVLTPDDEIRRLAGLEIGMKMTATLVDEAAARLRATRRFQSVDVRKRYASISDPAQIAVVIVVDEGAVHVDVPDGPGARARVVKNRLPRVMFLPILNATDGYGLTYGVRFAFPDTLGARSRIAIPLSWGGQRQAAVEVDKQLATDRLTRITGGAGVFRRTNPFFDAADTRSRVWGRAEREIVRNLRAGVSGTWQHVSFAGDEGHAAAAGADVTLDTRLDPVLARNAVYLHAGLEHAAFGRGRAANVLALDARGYLGLVGQTILVARVRRDDADAPLPGYDKVVFGGIGTVRGFRAGAAAGDTDVAASLEWLVPLTSPLHLARLGVSAFADTGAAYDKGATLAGQHLDTGVGGSVWVTAAFVRFSLAVAHGVGASTRVHVGGTVDF